ncbi:MAG: ABC transporter permease [Chloroflexota bacterium]
MTALRARLRQSPGAVVVGGLLAILLVLNAFLNPARLAPGGILTTIGLAASLILAALASTPSILSGGGGIDISIGPMMGLLNVVMVRYLFMNGVDSPFIVIPLVLLAGTLLGALNGVLVAYLRLQPIVATLGTYLVFFGLAPWVLSRPGGSTPDWLTSEASIVAIVFVGVIWFAITRTPLYQDLMAIGGSAKAAYTAGINVQGVRLFAYALGGFIAGVAALALTALLGSGDPGIGTSITMKAIAAVALGGVSLAGGRGGFVGAAAGALVIFLLQLSMTGLNWSTFVVQMAFGTVLVLAVLFNAVVVRRR